jgi:hypothetical protein
MSELEITLIASLTIVLVISLFVFVYARSAVLRLLTAAEEMSDLKIMIDNFDAHLTQVYSLETFYGDQTLQGLMDHSRSLSEQLENFEFLYSLVEIEEEDNEEIDNQEKEN